MNHLDLFSGIGGFALACQWNGIETISFVEIDKFCQKVLKKHWPDVPIVEDIRDVKRIKEVVANASRERLQEPQYNTRDNTSDATQGRAGMDNRFERLDSLLLTAGFPCQPFSCAGRRKGKADDRYLWPETLAVIEAVKPDWVLLENVAGILNMVFPDSAVGVASQASFCEVPNEDIADYGTIIGGIKRDLRQAGYETVWLVIPACAVGAPHRRDRVWVIGNSTGNGWHEPQDGQSNQERGNGDTPWTNQVWELEGTDSLWGIALNAKCEGCIGRSSRSGTDGKRLEANEQAGDKSWGTTARCNEIPGWPEDWYEVATRFCRVDDGISNRVDRLKALGNAIVPQVAYEIIRAIKEADRVSERHP